MPTLEKSIVGKDHNQPPGVEDEHDDAEDQWHDEHLDVFTQLIAVLGSGNGDGAEEDEDAGEDPVGNLDHDSPNHEGQTKSAALLQSRTECQFSRT